MNKRARVAELKARLSAYLRVVKRGGVVEVYDRDTPVARLVPYARSEPMVVRERGRKYGRLADVPLPPPVALDRDVVELLLEDRYSGR
jgi:prevent-host-death family protein